MEYKIEVAKDNDFVLLCSLLRLAHLGIGMRKPGWTHDAHLTRSLSNRENELKEILNDPHSLLLMYRGSHTIKGCVALTIHGTKLFLRLLAVFPDDQSRGIGKILMDRAEEFGRGKSCNSVAMLVHSARHDLLQWFNRRGYYALSDESIYGHLIAGGRSDATEFLTIQKELTPSIKNL